MIKPQWQTFLFWLGAILIIVLVTVFYQPAAAKTGALLIWMNNRIYVMDIDSLILERVGAAAAGEQLAPSPGCYGQGGAACWVVAGQNLYPVNRPAQDNSRAEDRLPTEEGVTWLDDGEISWSPDGRHLVYSVFNQARNQAELRLYDVTTGKVETLASGVDPAVAPAWSAACAEGLDAADCRLAFKTRPVNIGVEEVLPAVVALNLASGERSEWELPAEPVFELRWTATGELLYSRPKRYFRHVTDHTPAFDIPAAGQLGSMSPDGRYTVYYQPFTLADCQAETEEGCLHLGVWLTDAQSQANDPRLIYSLDLIEARQSGLNFIPVWAPNGQTFVFFQAGHLIYYDLVKQEATIWYKSLQGKLRSLPVFSPNEEAVAFVDDQGQGFSQYRLVVINPRLQPLEHIIQTDTGFRVLAWLPN